MAPHSISRLGFSGGLPKVAHAQGCPSGFGFCNIIIYAYIIMGNPGPTNPSATLSKYYSTKIKIEIDITSKCMRPFYSTRT